jgi:hypothetical protein
MCGLDPSSTGQGLVAGSCEHGDEISGSIKMGNSLASRATNFSRRTLPHGDTFISVRLLTFGIGSWFNDPAHVCHATHDGAVFGTKSAMGTR